MIKNSLWMASAIILSFAATSFATEIPVNNNSFEDSGLAPGGWDNVLPDWTNAAGEGDGSAFIEHITGFAAEGTHHIGLQSGTTVYQDVGNFEPNTIYTMTVNVGNRNDSFTSPGNTSTWEIQDTSGNVFATGVFDAEANVADGSFSDDQSIVYTTPAAGGPTGAVRLALLQVGAGRSHWDNVRLDGTNAVPEPSTIVLLALGACGLLVNLLRRRRTCR